MNCELDYISSHNSIKYLYLYKENKQKTKQNHNMDSVKWTL